MTSQEDLIDKYLDRVGKPQPTFKNKKGAYTKDMLDHSHHQPFGCDDDHSCSDCGKDHIICRRCHCMWTHHGDPKNSSLRLCGVGKNYEELGYEEDDSGCLALYENADKMRLFMEWHGEDEE